MHESQQHARILSKAAHQIAATLGTIALVPISSKATF